VPTSYRKKAAKWIPAEERGKLILFRSPYREIVTTTSAGIFGNMLKRVRVSS
jgi:hypothetical protein